MRQPRVDGGSHSRFRGNDGFGAGGVGPANLVPAKAGTGNRPVLWKLPAGEGVSGYAQTADACAGQSPRGRRSRYRRQRSRNSRVLFGIGTRAPAR